MFKTYWQEDGTKSRLVTYIIYPDSVKEDWIDILTEMNVKAVVSPLHNLDVDKNGELEKPHYHVVVKFDGPITWSVANDICISINAYSRFQKVRNIHDIINYLTHDSYTSDGKMKYDKDDIQFINCNLYYFSNCEFIELIKIINDNEIMSLCDLIDYLIKNYLNDLCVYAIKNCYFVNSYINSSVTRRL